MRLDQALDIGGVKVFKAALDREHQKELVSELRDIVSAAPLVTLRVKSGAPMSVRTSAAGKYGWFSDRAGYRYIPTHPSGTAWPQIPESILKIWMAVADTPRDPDCCLLNFYSGDSKMGMHQDKDESDFSFPVVSISLGDAALFRVGGTTQGGSTQSVWLESGDICVIGGSARLAYHGVDRIRSDSSSLLSKGGRINLTLRVVD